MDVASDAFRAALESGDESAIERGMAALEAGLEPRTLLALVKGMLSLGLPGLAELLLTTVGRPLLADASLAALAERLGTIRTDRVPHAEQARFAAVNLAALRRRCAIDLDQRELDALVTSNRIDVLRDRRGRTHPLVRDAEGRLRILGTFRLTPPAEATAAISKLRFPNVAVAGLAPPHVLLGLVNATAPASGGCRVIAFECDLLAFAAWLRSGDLSAAIDAGSLVVRMGATGVAAHLAAIEESLAEPPIHGVVLLRSEVADRLSLATLPAASDARWQGALAKGERAAAARYAPRDAAWFARRFETAERSKGALRIAVLASRHTTVVRHMARDLLQAFHALGHETVWLTEPEESMPIIDLVRPFAQGDIDLVVAFNYLARFPNRLLPVDLPYVAWLQDLVTPAQTSEAGASQGPMDLLVAHSGGFYESRFGYPPGQSIDAPNLTSWATYGSIGEERRSPNGLDLVYVGHGAESAEDVADRNAATPDARALLRAAAARFRVRLLADDAPNGFERMRIAAELLAEAGLAAGRGGPAIYFAMQSVYDRLFRHQALEWAAAWARSRGRRFAIFGRGWGEHPTLASCAAGEIENGKPLAELCRDATVVLHANGNASLHQRLLDALAAGGCVLTRWNPADELSAHHRRLVAVAHTQRVDSLADLRALPGAAEPMEEIERCLGCAIRPSGDPRRDADCTVLRRLGLWPEETLSDQGFLRHLVSARGLFTPHGAADLEGFSATTYRTEQELHNLLDRIVASEELRHELRTPMRESVRDQFTMEVLASRMIASMADQLRRAAAGPPS